MKTLKQAIREGKLEEFLKEHENDPQGDLDAFNEMLEKATNLQKKKSARET